LFEGVLILFLSTKKAVLRILIETLNVGYVKNVGLSIVVLFNCSGKTAAR